MCLTDTTSAEQRVPAIVWRAVGWATWSALTYTHEEVWTTVHFAHQDPETVGSPRTRLRL